jgi:hypothetical protein
MVGEPVSRIARDAPEEGHIRQECKGASAGTRRAVADDYRLRQAS